MLYDSIVQIAEALRESAAESGLNATQVAARIGRGEQVVTRYMRGNVEPSGAVLLAIMREIPGVAQRLGFRPVMEEANGSQG